MKYVMVLTTVVVLLVIVPLGAAQNSPSVSSKSHLLLSAAAKSPGTAAQAGWEKKWQDTLEAAKQEGEVMIYMNVPTDARAVLSDAFFKKFGLKLNATTASGADLQGKLISEYRAGINQVDVFMPGGTSTINAKKQGILTLIEPLLILPEVRDPKAWLYGKLPFFDRDGMVLAYLALRNPNIFYNADLVKEGEITSYSDLLKPNWKGKIVMYDPTIPGAALSGSYFLSLDWGGNEKVYEYILSLIKQQDAVMTRDMRQQVEWVARGKSLVALWPQLPATSQFLKAGAPLAAASLKEKGRVGSSNGALGMPVKPPHPNAAIVFLNWFLSREGQAVAVKAIGAGSARTDVAPEGVHSVYIPKPDEKYHLEIEETIQSRPQFQGGLKKVLSQLNK